MKFIFLYLVLLSAVLSAQNENEYNSISEDSIIVHNGKKDSLKIFKPVINDYKVKTQHSEEKIFDTVFSYEKTYVFSQFNNKDNFGRIQFPNSGQSFNPMVYEPNSQQNLAVLPTGKSFNILGVDDINYYNVKTPTTVFIFHNAPENGTVLSSTYTQNIRKDFNFFINYMGLRSRGIYQRNLSVNNNFNFGVHYKNEIRHYELYAHYLNQNVNNEENGGIADPMLFLGNDSRFNIRLNLAVRLNNSQSFFNYRRYYLNHDIGLFRINDVFPIKIRHLLMYEGNKYYYDQKGSEEGLFPMKMYPMIPNFTQFAKKYSDKLTNIISLVFDTEKFKLDTGLKYHNITLGVNQIYLKNQIQNDVKWKDTRVGIDGNLKIKILEKLDFNSSAEYTTGSKLGKFLRVNNKVIFIPTEGFSVEGKLNFQSAVPSFNLLINGSQYRDFNYSNLAFKNQSIFETGGLIRLKWFDISAFLNYYSIGNYTYINSDYQVQQSTSSVNITESGGEATLKYKNFHLNGKALFQSVINNKNLIPIPSFLGRANVYFQSKMFKGRAEIQTGIKAYYFSKFASREFFPVLNEFVLPGTKSYPIGGRPIMDLYINLKVKTMMIFIEGQHINSILIKNKSFASPYYPVADYRINLGIVWYIFS